MNAARQAGCVASTSRPQDSDTCLTAYKSASLKDRKPFALIVLDAPSVAYVKNSVAPLPFPPAVAP